MMSDHEPDVTIQVDITNPGEYFACCGLLELADRLCKGAEGWFENNRFHLILHDDETHPSDKIYNALIHATVTPEPYAEAKEKILPVLIGNPVNIRLDWWLRQDGKSKAYKTWGGNQDSRKMFSKCQKPLATACKDLESPINLNAMFQITCNEQGTYGYDTQAKWTALSAGFSLNEHDKYKDLPTRPAIEMLGAIGLQRFLPEWNSKEYTFTYATWSVPLDPATARAAAAGRLPAAGGDRLQTRFFKKGSYKGVEQAQRVHGGMND